MINQTCENSNDKTSGKKQRKKRRGIPVTCYLTTTHLVGGSPVPDQPTWAGEGWGMDPFGNRLAVLWKLHVPVCPPTQETPGLCLPTSCSMAPCLTPAGVKWKELCRFHNRAFVWSQCSYLKVLCPVKLTMKSKNKKFFFWLSYLNLCIFWKHFKFFVYIYLYHLIFICWISTESVNYILKWFLTLMNVIAFIKTLRLHNNYCVHRTLWGRLKSSAWSMNWKL